MNSIGFGLERIGLAALARPVIFFIGLLTLTLMSVYFLFSVTFEGSVAGVLPKQSENYLAYKKQQNGFRNFSKDVAIIVQSDGLLTSQGLDALRELQLELSLSDGVLSAVSVMALPTFNTETKQFQTFFSGEIGDDAQVKVKLDALMETYPQARSLIDRDTRSAIILVALDIDTDASSNKEVFNIFRSLKQDVEEYADPSFEIHYAGLTPISLTILETLLKDQLRLTLLGLGLGAIIGIIFFRSVVAAIICSVPPMLTALWGIGFFGFVGVPITYMTTVLPTLALVLAYADGIVLFHRWNKMNRDGDHNREQIKANLHEAIKKVGPASALTSLTTAFALISFVLSSSEALIEFAWVGVVLVMLAFLAVIVSIPLLGLAMIRLGWVSTGGRTWKPFRFGTFVSRIYEKVPRLIALGAVVCIAGFIFIHFKLQPNYTITELLPVGSQSHKAEEIANTVFGGRSLVFFMVPTDDREGISSPVNRQRLSKVAQLLSDKFGEDKVYSIDALWSKLDETNTNILVDRLKDAPDFTKQGYISNDKEWMLISLRVPTSQSIAQTKAVMSEIQTTLKPLSFSNEIIVTGFPVLLATEFSKLIDELRNNLLIAALMGIVLIGFATRSIFCAMAVATPNLFPILFVEAFIYFKYGNIGVIEVVALTLAFGIAIDNAVHLVNVYLAQDDETLTIKQRLRIAVKEVAPALSASTLIICAGFAVGITSSLPILSTIGTLIVATLVTALLTNLFILPSNLLVFSGKEDRKK